MSAEKQIALVEDGSEAASEAFTAARPASSAIRS
jgi:hypothetical protein